ncbi:COG1896 Predicted hydrolases of HD superfamily [uncultured Caudovirales phage]|uniref:COG1896 Predicted hydrolases of HD superfamily n=1 Tax=uncultured Caudovirales phage TaxID=2100421 RepID=A0A6J7WDU3_9CAUD|nr:COG1896 Predicted hydrolases of HD superfamily [uncultured Caudovirales phage]CAB5208686.1 COG1896 Predicted hydrolases of HD superfamily [uncultured Caudovirales phage]
MATLETVSGRKIDITNPDPSTIVIEDIAWALSRLPRFSGHSIPYVPYSVAQHCIQVANDLKEHGPEVQLFGLLHDAAEAYINDLPSPVKHIPEIHAVIKKLEDSLMETIYTALDIDPPTYDEEVLVKIADKTQQAVEAYNYMYSRGADWNLPEVSFKKLQEFESPLTSVEAYDKFLLFFKDLMNQCDK